MKQLKIANNRMTCEGCGLQIEEGDWFSPVGPRCYTCVSQQTPPKPKAQAPANVPLLFEDRPREIIQTVKDALGASSMDFDGATYEQKYDQIRLSGQIYKTFTVMSDGIWRTIDEIHNLTGVPHTSVSAQLRHLRKPQFGSHTVDRRARGDRARGLFEYRLTARTRQPPRAA